MSGSLDKNLLSGYLSEELGIYLLRGVAAVAPVSRPQDVGIDAVATLLRQSTSRTLIPENTFYVQLKSNSVRTIMFTTEQVAWLSHLQLPYFVGSVNKKLSEISLYTSHRWLIESRRLSNSPVTFLLDPPEHLPNLEAFPTGPISPDDDGTLRLWLGPPILVWSVSQIGQVDFLPRMYQILKFHLETDDRNIRWRRLKYGEFLQWRTNEPPTASGWTQAVHGTDNLQSLQPIQSIEEVKRKIYEAGLNTILGELRTPILALIMHTLMNFGPETDFSEVYSFVQFMRANNSDPFCGNWVENEAKRRFPTSAAALANPRPCA